ncbi:MAG: rubredoxin-like domain-containing protein [Desulforhopalus sp.]
MSGWECEVCGYIHKEDEVPDTCPVCEAPKKMFTQLSSKKSEENAEPVSEETGGTPSPKVKQWRCSVSGYIHTGTAPPEKCPICEATAEQFEEVIEGEEGTGEEEAAPGRRWRCTICGYIHVGEEPPEKCPVCDAPRNMFEEIDAEGKTIGAPVVEEPEVDRAVVADMAEKVKPSLFNRIGDLIMKFHLHPISVHFPNGILPAVVVFLAIAVFFNMAMFEKAAYFNLIFVLIMMPMVMLTGYIEWQKRYKGIKTMIFIVKIICALVVLAAVNVLVFWRLLDPTVASEGSPYQLVYLGVAVAMVGAAGVAGHLGGKLVFGARG